MSIESVDVRSRRALGFTPMETSREVIVEAAVLAEQCGYEAVVVPEGWGLDAPTVLTEIALRTTRLRLVAGVLSVWGRSAATIAMTAATLDQVSGGRFTLGLGASTPPLAQRFHGVTFTAPADRLRRTLLDVRTLLRGGRATGVDGGPGLRLAQPARPDLPVWVAGLGPRSERVATRFADAWFPMMLPRDSVAARRRAAADGETAASFVTGVVAQAGLRAEARRHAAQLVGWYLLGMGPFYAELAAASGFATEVAALRAANPRPAPGAVQWPAEAEPLLHQLAVCGTPEEVAAGLATWDRLADLVVVGVAPGPLDSVAATVEAGAPRVDRAMRAAG
jgi:alkanesulfonate monooxygenase SsuD/methylene tetrahydromethanopterin reductase-like flavin-dependent oxidoreductase (luciferase family)